MALSAKEEESIREAQVRDAEYRKIRELGGHNPETATLALSLRPRNQRAFNEKVQALNDACEKGEEAVRALVFSPVFLRVVYNTDNSYGQVFRSFLRKVTCE